MMKSFDFEQDDFNDLMNPEKFVMNSMVPEPMSNIKPLSKLMGNNNKN